MQVCCRASSFFEELCEAVEDLTRFANAMKDTVKRDIVLLSTVILIANRRLNLFFAALVIGLASLGEAPVIFCGDRLKIVGSGLADISSKVS